MQGARLVSEATLANRTDLVNTLRYRDSGTERDGERQDQCPEKNWLSTED